MSGFCPSASTAATEGWRTRLCKAALKKRSPNHFTLSLGTSISDLEIILTRELDFLYLGFPFLRLGWVSEHSRSYVAFVRLGCLSVLYFGAIEMEDNTLLLLRRRMHDRMLSHAKDVMYCSY